MDEIVPREELARFTRFVVEEMHSQWDGMHQFLILIRSGDRITPRMVGVIDPAMHPDMYPAVLTKLAKEDIAGMKDGDPAPVAYLLQFEAFGVKMPPEEEMTARQRADFDRDRRNRTFGQRDDAVEACMAMACDVTGRIYQATKYRNDGSIREEQIEPLGSGVLSAGGQMTRALRGIAYATGMAEWGLPGPPGLAN